MEEQQNGNVNLKEELKKNGGIIRNESIQSFVCLKDVNKIYPNGIQAVYDFNIDIKQHDFIVLVGPSGCGKSTTLRMIAGLEDISSGYLYIDKVLSNYIPSKDRDISMVFQSYALYPQMTVYDNIAFPLKARKYDKIVKVLSMQAKTEFDAVKKQPELLFEGIIESLDRKLNYASLAVYVSTKLKIQEATAKLILSHKDLLALARKAFGDSDNLVKYQLEFKTLFDSKKEEIDATLNRMIAAEKQNYESKGFTIKEDGVVYQGEEPLHQKVKLTKEEIRQKVFEAAKILDLGPYLDRRPKELSGGQMQRVALGRAIVRNAKVFLMDEPLSNLDAKLRVQMRSEIVRLHERIGATTIYVTHDQTEAMTMATRIAVMSKGWCQQIGEPEVIYSRPNNIFVATFIGSPAMNIFEGTYEDGKLALGDGFVMDMGAEFKTTHDAFYNQKLEETKGFLAKNPVKKMHGLFIHDEILRLLADERNLFHYSDRLWAAVSKGQGEEKLVPLTVGEKKVHALVKDEGSKSLDEIHGEIKAMMEEQINAKVEELKAVIETIDDKDHDALAACFAPTAEGQKELSLEARLKAAKPLLLNIMDITTKELSILHNTTAFSKGKKSEKEMVLFYTKRHGKAKAAVKGYKSSIHVKDSNVVLTNNLWLVLTELERKYEAALRGKHDVRIGIRPEHIHLAREFNYDKKSNGFTVNSDVVELLGSELLVHANYNNVDMIAKISARTLVKAHEDIELSCELDKVLAFDVNSGDTIAPWSLAK